MGKALTVEEVAEYLGLAKDTVYRKAKAGEIPGVRIGRSWRFPQDIVDEWLRAKVVGQGSKDGERLGAGRKKEEVRVEEVKKLSPSELRRRRRVVREILRLRKHFEKLPITADEAYRISRRELERRPLRWK
jgi:excisionase family DNA binding protein